MPSFTLILNHFSQPIPVCELTANTEEVLTLFQSGQSEMIVVVDGQQQPLGILSWQQLLPYLLPQKTKSRKSKPCLDLKALMQPIATLSAQLEIEAFYPQLQADSDRPYALIDNQGKFVGLLDNWRLLTFLLQAYSSKQSQNTTIKELLDQLPLPVTLCTAQKQVIYQNHQWEQQIGESLPLTNAHIRPLETPSFVHQPTHLLSRQAECLNYCYYPRQTVAPQLAIDENFSKTVEILPSLLESSKTGTDKIWQLVTVPFHLSTADTLVPLAPVSLWLVLATDVTQQQSCSQELAIKNADLVHLNRLKDEFLACISHELKSPLTAVVGLSSLLKEQKIGELNTRQARYADLIYRSGRQLMSLVNDLLDLTRLETGQLKLNPTLVSIRAICQRAYHLIEEKYRSKSPQAINFSLEIEPGLEQLIADELRLQQMLVHLLDNATKFTEEGGKIGLKVNYWEKWLAFTVWDTGIGIPEESQHLIFQKFQQLESPLTRQFEGTGLGLVLTQHLAKAHGGDISFISQVGQGSQFTLLLPPQPSPTHLSSHITQYNPIVLVIEAMPKAINHLTEQLNDLGYRVIVARTGTEAIEKARQLQPQRIFLNPILPLLSGWDVLTLLKAHPQTKTIPVIITASAQMQDLSQLNGAQGFLPLPITRQALQEQLNPPTSYFSSNQKDLTILRLYGLEEVGTSPLQGVWSNQLPQLNHRLLEADSLEQAEMIASVWDVDVVIVDATVAQSLKTYLRSLSQCYNLATLPLVTLDAQITQAANQIEGLSVFPCLLPDTENCLDQLLQVIQIATETRN